MKDPVVNPGLLPIIVIDDDQDELDLMCDTFKQMSSPHPLICFLKPSDALVHLQKDGSMVHFTICDVHMPLMDGYALREAMLKQPAVINDRPFFIVSSVFTSREIGYLPILRIDRFYSKAFTYEKLLANCTDMLKYAAK